jgi:hypothetical protein
MVRITGMISGCSVWFMLKKGMKFGTVSKRFAGLTMLTISAAWTSPAAEIVADEITRRAVLQLAFPNARILSLSGQAKREPYAVTDPMGRPVAMLSSSLEYEYEVIGLVAKEEEEPAIDIRRLPERWLSDKRHVSMQLYRWNPANNGEALLVAVMDYSFPDANPARCCRAVGKILLLPIAADHIFDKFDKVPYAFTTFTSVRFVDVDGSGTEKLMVGADTSGVASTGVSSAVFDLSSHKLTPLLSIDTVVLYEADLNDLDIHNLTLDERGTIGTKGLRFFFVKKTFAEKANVLAKPRTSRVSYPVRHGVPLDWQ